MQVFNINIYLPIFLALEKHDAEFVHILLIFMKTGEKRIGIKLLECTTGALRLLKVIYEIHDF